jgi:hypothetical protein
VEDLMHARLLAPVVLLGLALSGCTATAGAPVAAPSTVTVTEIIERTVTVGATPTVDTRPAASSPVGSITPIDAVPDACSLLTQDEANTLAGRKLQAAVAAGTEQGVTTMCQFSGDPNDSGVAQVTVFTGDGAQKALEVDRDTLEHEFTRCDGIGDECWQEDKTIFFRKGSVWAEIALVYLDEDPHTQAMQDAAKIALGRY